MGGVYFVRLQHDTLELVFILIFNFKIRNCFILSNIKMDCGVITQFVKERCLFNNEQESKCFLREMCHGESIL